MTSIDQQFINCNKKSPKSTAKRSSKIIPFHKFPNKKKSSSPSTISLLTEDPPKRLPPKFLKARYIFIFSSLQQYNINNFIDFMLQREQAQTKQSLKVQSMRVSSNSLLDSQVQKYNQNATEIYTQYQSREDWRREDGGGRFGDLTTFSSSNYAPTQTSFPSDTGHVESQPERLTTQFLNIISSFHPIHSKLIFHSYQQSKVHQNKLGLKVISINNQNLSRDYSNKISIIKDLDAIIQNAQKMVKQDAKDLEIDNYRTVLENKFQEYYLERHYGNYDEEVETVSMREDIQRQNQADQEEFSISLEDKLEASRQLEGYKHYSNLLQEYEALSKIGGFQSCYNKVEGNEISCQTQPEFIEIRVPILKIIEVEIPHVIYTVKLEQSEIFQSMDQIISKYSKPYEQQFKQHSVESQIKNQQQQQQQKSQHPNHEESNLMLVSRNSGGKGKETEVDFSYSDFVEEAQNSFKLPLDSYAQLDQSLISNSNSLIEQQPKTNILINSQNIIINESQNISLIEKYEQAQRQLNIQNTELKEQIQILEEKVQQINSFEKQKQKEIEKLSYRLEEEIKQNQYYMDKFDEADFEVMEEKLQCFVHLNQSQTRKIQMQGIELEKKCQEIAQLMKNKQVQLEKQNYQQQLKRKDEQIEALQKRIEEMNSQIYAENQIEEEVIQFAKNKEENLKQQIQKLENQNSKLKEVLKQYKKRQEYEGINFDIEEVQEIKYIIEEKEKDHYTQLKEVNQKYDSVISGYKNQLLKLKEDIKKAKKQYELNQQQIENLQQKSKVTRNTSLRTTMCTTINSDKSDEKSNKMGEEYFEEFEAIIKEYDEELEKKDQEIVEMKSFSIDKNRKIDENSIIMYLEHSLQKIQKFERMFEEQRKEKLIMTSKLIELQQMIYQEVEEQRQREKYERDQKIIEQLTKELEKKFREKQFMKKKLEDQQKLLTSTNNLNNDAFYASLKKENQKYCQINKKLRNYNHNLERELQNLTFMSECEYHKEYLNRFEAQKKELMDTISPVKPELVI